MSAGETRVWLFVGALSFASACSACSVPTVIGPSDEDSGRTKPLDEEDGVGDLLEQGAVDDLGRLLTGQGLCGITGVWAMERGFSVEAELSYDERGRPNSVTSRFTPNCMREEPSEDARFLGGRLPCYEDRETQWLAWRWDDAGNLLAIEHSVEVDFGGDVWSENPDDPRRDAEDGYGDRACLVEGLFVIERSEWAYDESGLAAWEQSYADCDGLSIISETHRRYPGGVEVTRTEASEIRVLEFGLDADGRVVDSAGWRYRYDELGRLIHAKGTAEAQSWRYDAEMVADADRVWRREVSVAGRTITLVGEGRDARVQITVDGEGRPSEVLTAHDRWTLRYGGCPNAERATARWLVHDVFDAWPFPALPMVGEALEQRETWTRGQLPLVPF